MIPDDFFFLVDRREISEEGQGSLEAWRRQFGFLRSYCTPLFTKRYWFSPGLSGAIRWMYESTYHIHRGNHSRKSGRKPIAFRNNCTTCMDGSVVTANAEGLSRLAKYQRSTCTSSRGCTWRLSLRRLYQDHIPVIEPRDLLVVSSNRSKGAL
jgi:hypothetical protein